MPKLKRMKIKAVALVDKGANRREFFLVKSQKGGKMNKESVVEILKSAKGLSQERASELIALVPESERAEVLALVKAADGVENADTEVAEVEQLIEKVGAKFAKATSDQLKVLQEHFAAMQSILTELVNGLKEDEPTPVEAEKAATDKAKAEADAGAGTEDENKDPEVNEDEFQKMLDEGLKAVQPQA